MRVRGWQVDALGDPLAEDAVDDVDALPAEAALADALDDAPPAALWAPFTAPEALPFARAPAVASAGDALSIMVPKSPLPFASPLAPPPLRSIQIGDKPNTQSRDHAR